MRSRPTWMCLLAIAGCLTLAACESGGTRAAGDDAAADGGASSAAAPAASTPAAAAPAAAAKTDTFKIAVSGMT